MAIFSNLEGTMSKSFILGKNGAQFNTDGTEVQILNYQGTLPLPVSAADPQKSSHLVTLSYFQAHTSSANLSGTVAPDTSLGLDGNVYYQVDDTSVIKIYFKDQGIWKPLSGTTPPVDDSDYVTSYTIQPNQFVANGSSFSFILPASEHGRGSSLLVQVQDPTGDDVGAGITVDGSGNITVNVNSVPTTTLEIKIIGATTMTTPYSAEVNKIDWTASGDKFTMTVSAAVHGQKPGPLYVGIYENTVDGPSSAQPFNPVTVDTSIDSAGNVTFDSYASFSGKLVISGK